MPIPRLNKENNPGDARWCDQHERLECVKSRSVRQGGGLCHASAIRGTHACKTHGGHRRDVARVKGQARISAWSAMGRPGPGESVDASAAVMGMLQQSWLRAAMYSHLLHGQVMKDGTGPEQDLSDPDGDVPPKGLIGYRYGAAGKDGHIYAVSEEARGLVSLEAAERDRVVKFAKTAHDMGISDRLISMAEQWGDQVVTRILVIMSKLDLTPEQDALVPALIQAHLGSIELGAGTES